VVYSSCLCWSVSTNETTVERKCVEIRSETLLYFKLLYFLTCKIWNDHLFVFNQFLCSSSSATLRKLSSVRVSFRIIPFTILFVSLTFIHMLVYYKIILEHQQCDVESSTYAEFDSFCNLIMWSWVPSLGMFIFTLLTLRNVRQGKRRIAPQKQSNYSTEKSMVNRTTIDSNDPGSMSSIRFTNNGILNRFTLRCIESQLAIKCCWRG